MTRKGNLVLPAITLDRTATTAAYRQLANQLAAAIRRGTLDGAQLPSTRMLARTLGISRNTVLAAYDELAARGLIETRRGSGTRVPRVTEAPMGAFAVLSMLRDAQYPARTLGIADVDGAPIYLVY
jgi:DNA-binding GntR family transcriptional regulator